MLSVKQAAEKLGVSDSLVYAWCAAGLLPHCRMGRPGKRGRVLVDPVDLDAFIAERKRVAATRPGPAPFALKHIRTNCPGRPDGQPGQR